jgi:tetratricopeptide (TPR) repeat protein
MSSNLATMDPRCDLIRLERANMVTKLEDRIKLDLVATSKLILDHLRLCDSNALSSTPEMLNRIASQFNLGSLLQYHYGEIERAETLCRGAIELFARLSSSSANRAFCFANMVQPYINLGRIYGQKGEVRKSLSIFEDIYRFTLQQQDLSIFGHRILVTDGPAMFAAAPGYHRAMLSCRVIDATRVLQTIEDYPALLALAETYEGLPEYQDAFFKQYLREVRSRALLNMGQYEMAMEALADCCRQMPLNATDRIAIQSLVSQIYREWGNDDLAGATLNKLEDYLARGEKFRQKYSMLRQIAYRLALERHAMGDDSRALGFAEKAFKFCSERNDEPGSIKSAILLLRICTGKTRGAYPPAMRRHWYDELQRLASTTFFRLERACAYWELGLSSGLVESDDERTRESPGEFLRHSYNLYHSVPFVDSRRSCEAVKLSLDSWERRFPTRTTRANEIMMLKSSSIDSTFDALMKYVPESFVTNQ